MIDLEEAIRYSKEMIEISSAYDKVTFSKYSKVFFSSTENIKGYLDNIDFNRNRALTVLSGGDHIFNLIHAGVEKIDAFDVNRLTYYVYHLRKAMVNGLSLEEYINYNYFFTCGGYIDELIETLKKLKKFMPEDVYEYYRKILEFCYNFSLSIGILYYGPRIAFKKINNYLVNEEEYNKLQRLLDNSEVNLCFDDARKMPCLAKGTYDLVLLSNISDYFGTKNCTLGIDEFKAYIRGFEKIMNKDGVLVNYLYFLNNPFIIKDSDITINDLGKENIFGFKNSEFSGEGYYRVRKVSENKSNVKN